jgi:hypothetical protein
MLDEYMRMMVEKGQVIPIEIHAVFGFIPRRQATTAL